MEKKYASLRMIAELIKIAAVIILIFSLYVSISMGITANDLDIFQGFANLTGYSTLLIILGIAVSFIIFILMLAISASIYVLLDTEENTRRSAQLLQETKSANVTE